MQTVHETIRAAIERYSDHVEKMSSTNFEEETQHLEADLIDAFGWHPISRAEEFGLRTPPAGKLWGPRLVALCQGENEKGPALNVVYWDPDTVQPDGRPVAFPKPYWRAVGMSAGWSRRNPPVFFRRPHALHRA